MMTNIEWESLPSPVTGVVSWGARGCGVTYMVTFDRLYPEEGHLASYRRRGEKVVYLDSSFSTLEEAQKAVVETYERRRHDQDN